MNVHDKVALRQLALRNPLVSKKTKIEARRERILADVNKMVSERRALDTKLAMLDELLRSRGGIPTGAGRPSEGPGSIPRPSPPPPPPEHVIRESLVTALQERYRETDFGIQEFHTLMNDLAPQASFKFETAWRVCNDLVSRRVIKQVSQRVTEKGLVRRLDRKSTRLNSSHSQISYAAF